MSSKKEMQMDAMSELGAQNRKKTTDHRSQIYHFRKHDMNNEHSQPDILI